jgi:hypothetical protein
VNLYQCQIVKKSVNAFVRSVTLTRMPIRLISPAEKARYESP